MTAVRHRRERLARLYALHKANRNTQAQARVGAQLQAVTLALLGLECK